MSTTKLFRKIMLLFIFGLVFFFLLTSFLGFYGAIRPPKIISKITPADLGLKYETVSFTTSDNITLQGWFIPQQTAEADTQKQTPDQNDKIKTIILLHGYPADKGDILATTAFLNQRYNLFFFDFRYLGQSSGKYSTAGAKETQDLKAAINYLKSRGLKEVGAWGFSVGGAVALMTAPTEPAIQALVAESSYARLDLLAPDLYRIPGLRHPLGWLTGLWAKFFLGVNIKNVSPLAATKNLTIPVLLIHSPNDQVIPFAHAQLLQAALGHNPQAEFWFNSNLGHGQHDLEYQQRLLEFFTKNLP